VLLVDDGLATGATMLAAILALRSEQPKRIVLAVPVAARGAMSLLEPKVERVVALVAPESFHAVSDWYEDFTQVRDQDVIECLADARERTARATNAGR
jgi:putative phosphoribosyl transferase